MDTGNPAPTEPAANQPSVATFATFDRALEDYLASLPKDKKQFKFIELCRDSGTTVTPKALNELLRTEEARRTLTKPVKKIFSRVMRALMDYGEVIGQLASAQPLPCAIIWGALKVVIESVDRCDNMFESMKDELLSLAEYLERLALYEDLYGDSVEMQRLVFKSYTNIIRFWHRVHKECKRKVIFTAGRSLTSSALTKMRSIISEIHSVSASIAEQASLAQGQKDKEEYAQARTERELQSDWRERQSVANYLDLSKQIRDHLTPSDDVVRPNTRRHESNLRYLEPETCQWLLGESTYVGWWSPTSDARRLFCLSGPPGHGKSMLTSFAIRDQESRGAAVAYYFCQFSQECEDPTEILRLLAVQLFNVYFSRHLVLTEEFGHRILRSKKPEHVQDLINELTLRLLSDAGVCFFIDGLDEAKVAGISPVLEFLTTLRRRWGDKQVCLWVTKRWPQVRAVECYEKYIQPELSLSLELAKHTEADVVRFLQAKFRALETRFYVEQGDMEETDKLLLHAARSYLTVRAQGNFLWARLMTHDFEGEKRVADVKQLLASIIGDPPKELGRLYGEYLDQLAQRHSDRDNQRLASKVMSLVAYARRQLRLEELQEAAAFLAGHGKKKKAASDATRAITVMPLKTFLARYTTLLEVDGPDPEPAPSDSCRLVHSSVLEFIESDSATQQLHMSRLAIADACLVYLSRPVYTELLVKQPLSDGVHTWADTNGVPVDTHAFSQYAAKYWARHLEDLKQRDQTQIQGHVERFVASNNFQTCMQIQSIWVQGRFDLYWVLGQRSLLRAIPEWLIHGHLSPSKRLIVTKYWSDYLELIYDWRTLLSCGGCHDSDPNCSYLMFRGELNRIWWASLGPDHFFSKFQSRYNSFRLSQGISSCSEHFEALNLSTDQIVVVRLEYWNRICGFLEFICEHWTLSNRSSAPTLQKKQIISTSESQTNWALYAKPLSEGRGRLVARPTAFSTDAQILRIGAQLFRRDEDSEYHPVSSGENRPSYFEDASGRGGLVVIGSRSHVLAKQLQEPYRLLEHFGEDFATLERSAGLGEMNEADSLSESDAASYDSGSEWSSEMSSETSGDDQVQPYESWSEGSTEDEAEVASDCDTSDADSVSEIHGRLTDDGPESSVLSEQSDKEQSITAATDSDSDKTSFSTEKTPSELSLSAFAGLDDRQSEDSADADGLEVDARLGSLHHGRPLGQEYNSWTNYEPTVLLTALQCDDEGKLNNIFEYSCPLRFMLYDSPPAIHPHNSLVVWPLGGGDLLFADVVAKTYFTRQLRPSASRSRQISVKPQFSPCGQYLHVASLEVQVSQIDDNPRCNDRHCTFPGHRPVPEMHIYALLLTYRLSKGKPTRSPPILHHRVKVDLGKYEGTLRVSQGLPFVFTWTPCDLFVTRRANSLAVYRIKLFKDDIGDMSVLVPQKKIILPDSAARRDVHFLPLSDDVDGGDYTVIVGGETRVVSAVVEDLVQHDVPDEFPELQRRRILAPSIGAVLRMEDLGGWIKAEKISTPPGRSMGNLDMRKEKFDPVDDCDAIAY